MDTLKLRLWLLCVQPSAQSPDRGGAQKVNIWINKLTGELSQSGCQSLKRPGGTEMRKQWKLAPESWAAHQKHHFNNPRLLYLPKHRKEVNSLPWDGWFSLVSRNFLMFRLPALCCKNSHVSWAVPQNYPRCCVLASVLSFIHWIKHYSQLLGCASFFSADISPFLKKFFIEV